MERLSDSIPAKERSSVNDFKHSKQIRSEKGIHFEDVMFTFTRSLRLVTLFYANAFMSFSAVTCGILVVFCFYIKFSCVFMFFQIKINHRFLSHIVITFAW